MIGWTGPLRISTITTCGRDFTPYTPWSDTETPTGRGNWPNPASNSFFRSGIRTKVGTGAAWSPEHGIRWTRENTFITGIARAIGPLVKYYYRATGYAKSLELASLLAANATSEFFLPDGSYDREKFGTHTHSTTCVTSSLAQLADLTGDASLLERVRAFSNNGLWAIRDELGWVIESSADGSPPDMGRGQQHRRHRRDSPDTRPARISRVLSGCRADSTGPPVAVPTAGCAVHPRARESFKRRRTARRTGPPSAGRSDFPRRTATTRWELHKISFNMDIVGGVVGTLCEALREGVVKGADGVRVNLLLDQDTPVARVVAAGRPEAGVRVTPRHPIPLWIRLPHMGRIGPRVQYQWNG